MTKKSKTYNSAWRSDFELVKRYRTNRESFSFSEKCKLFSLIGLFFGVGAYIYLGMFKKGFLIFSLMLFLFIFADTLLIYEPALQSYALMVYVPIWIFCGLFLKPDYYDKEFHQQHMWKSLGFIDNTVAVGAVFILALGLNLYFDISPQHFSITRCNSDSVTEIVKDITRREMVKYQANIDLNKAEIQVYNIRDKGFDTSANERNCAASLLMEFPQGGWKKQTIEINYRIEITQDSQIYVTVFGL